MNYVVFDTETTSLDKPFCYNIGYIIANENGKVLVKRDYVVEQVWHNLPLFNSAYYANKRQIYVSRMRSRTVRMDKFGYICQQMRRDFRTYEVKCAFAYNSSFDEKVFDFNCDWYKCNNPFEELKILDIRGYVHCFIVNDSFKQFCEENEYFTETGNYSTTAETVYRYISENLEFEEEHTALSDSEIENEILRYALRNGAEFGVDYPTKISIKREIEKDLTLKTPNEELHFKYNSIRISKDKTLITLK